MLRHGDALSISLAMNSRTQHKHGTMAIKRTRSTADLAADASDEPPPSRRPDAHLPPAWPSRYVDDRCRGYPDTVRIITNEYGTSYDGLADVDVAAVRKDMRIKHDLLPLREYKQRRWADIAALKQLVDTIAQTPLRTITSTNPDDYDHYVIGCNRTHYVDGDIKEIVHRNAMRAVSHLYATGMLHAGELANVLGVPPQKLPALSPRI